VSGQEVSAVAQLLWRELDEDRRPDSGWSTTSHLAFRLELPRAEVAAALRDLAAQNWAERRVGEWRAGYGLEQRSLARAEAKAAE